jgi:transposase-like protein
VALVVTEALTLSTLASHFSDEAEAYRLVERIRWPDGPICPHCGSIDRAFYLTPKNGGRKTRQGSVSTRRVWKCKDCRKQFSVLVGTILSDSHIPLSKWLLAIYKMCAGKNGVSAHELHRDLGVTYKSAWFMAHRIRLAMERPPLVDKLRGIVEVDETYIGGSRRGTRPGRPGPESHKVPVVTLVARGGEARSQVMRRVTGKNIKAALDEHVAEDARLMTDDFPVYRKRAQRFASHETVGHRAKEYVRGDIHTNTVENYFGQLKRSIYGTHHHVSERHLHRYLSEFDYRYNTRKSLDGDRTVRAIRQVAGKRLRYRQSAAPEEA